MMGASTHAAMMIIAAQRVRGCVLSLIPRHARNPRGVGAHWFWGVRGRAEIGAAKESTGSVKIEQLRIRGRPIDQPSRRGVFTKSFVIRKPDPSAKLAVNLQN